MRTPLESIYARLDISPTWKNEWVLNQDFIYYRWAKGSKNNITIPKDFVFNWASLPRVFYIIGTPMATDTLIWALLHDYAYHKQTMTRKQADELFNEVMILTKVWTIKRCIYYLGVRIWWWVVRNKK